MKQLLLLSLMSVLGGFGALYHPFWAVLLYYTLAVLRPQYLWKWALPIDVRWSLLAAAMLVASLFLNAPKVLNRARFTLMSGLMTAYAFCLLMSCLMAYDPEMAQFWGIEYGKILLIAVLAAAVIDELWQVRWLALMIMCVLGYIAFEVNSLYFVNGRLDIFHHGYGGLDNNGAGLMLALGVPLAGAFALSDAKLWQRGAAAFIGALLMHAVLMTYSRGAMLSATVGILWLLIHHKPRHHAVAALLVVSIMVSVMAGKEIRERLLSTMNYTQDASAQSRLDSWSAAAEMIWDSPLLGHGIRNSNQFSRNYGADTFGRTIHNLYLQIGADTGLPAMTLYVAMIITAFVQLRRGRHMCQNFLSDQPRHQVKDTTIAQMPQVIRGLEGCVLTFSFGAMFLSMEVFELSWLLLTIAGLVPAVASRHIRELLADQERDPVHKAPEARPHWNVPTVPNLRLPHSPREVPWS
jgi:probable O-glycosylation ligase (exosortase A-associated)